MSSRTAGGEMRSEGSSGEKVSIEFRVSPEMKEEVGELVDANDETLRNVSQVARVLVAYGLENSHEAAEYGEKNDVSL